MLTGAKFYDCDPAGTRTQDPYIKSVLLYQLSYGIIPIFLGVQKYGKILCGQIFEIIFSTCSNVLSTFLF
jgi:hypothetical protein